jgi:hypothetical protein
MFCIVFKTRLRQNGHPQQRHRRRWTRDREGLWGTRKRAQEMSLTSLGPLVHFFICFYITYNFFRPLPPRFANARPRTRTRANNTTYQLHGPLVTNAGHQPNMRDLYSLGTLFAMLLSNSLCSFYQVNNAFNHLEQLWIDFFYIL